MIAHETPAAPDAVPNLLKVSESAFCIGLRLGRRFTPVCTENLCSGVMVMKSAQDGA